MALRNSVPAASIALAALLLTACSGVQSALDPAGRAAEDLARLWWWMAGAAVVIWAAVIALAVYAVRARPRAHPRRVALGVIGGGAAFPTVVLAGLLTYGLALMPDLLAPVPEDALRVHVSGEQWWWRVRYPAPDGDGFVELANEVHLPVGEPVELLLDSPDVIHAFWVPSLGGKIDMIPGRTNRLRLEPTRTGRFRGLCAEYCGASHALMNFWVVVEERAAFDAWLARQAQPARRGNDVFLSSGCGACHTIRGTPADGTVGPDLTHVGSRLSLGAGILPNDPSSFARWIGETSALKPEVHMPAFGMLRDEDLAALGTYLESLR